MEIATRMLKETTEDKCPVCREGWSNFMIISENLWACFKCGCTFVPKKVRKFELDGAKDKINERANLLSKAGKIVSGSRVGKTATPLNDFKCLKCDFVAKSKAGLVAHTRKHE